MKLGIPAALGLAALLLGAASVPRAHRDAAYRPHIDPAEFGTAVEHPYFPLRPGTTWTYVERHGRRTSENVVSVTHETRRVRGVDCVVVHDVVRTGGAIVEDTRDWYAQDRRGNVWYFGEDTQEFHGGHADTEGSWEAGVQGAEPGMAMGASPKPGPDYRQEYRAGVAEDMARVEALGDSVRVPYGTFTGCLRVREWTPLERGHETKWYARGVGLVRSVSSGGEVAVLVGMTHEPAKESRR